MKSWFPSTARFVSAARRMLVAGSLLFAVASPVFAQTMTGTDPVKIFILAGESNMHGKGTVSPSTTPGTLDFITLPANDPTGKYQFLKSGGTYVTRADVGIRGLVYSGAPNPGNLTINYGGLATGLIGPELGFGHVLGDAYQNKVLIVKVGVDGTTLAGSFCPPSSRIGDPEPVTSADKGFYYKEIIRLVNEAKTFLGATPYEIAGLGWHQGWNDRVNTAFSAAYETNMANFIKDIRLDLSTPSMPVVIASAAMDSGTGYSEVEKAQLKMADAAAYPAFAGNVAVVDTRKNYEDLEFWQSVAKSPADEGYHWNRNGKTFLHIGMAMGDAMSLVATNRIPSRLRSSGGSNGTTLSWKNGTEMPTSVRVMRNGVEIAAAAPVNPPAFVDATAPVGISNYELQFTMPGSPAQPLTISQNSGITGLQASDRINGIKLTWQNNLTYTAILVKRNGTTIAASLPGNTTTFVDNTPVAGAATYTVEPTDPGSTAASVQLTVSAAPRGTAVIYEPFDMTAATTLNDKPGGIGLDGNWVAGTAVEVTAGSFTFGTLPTFGNRIVRTTSNGTISINVGPSLAEAGLLDDGAQLWFSFLCPNPGNVNVSPNLVFGNDSLSSSTSVSNSGNAIGVRINGGTQVQAITCVGGGIVATSATQATLAATELALIVGKITWGATPAAVDTIEIYTPGTNLVLDTPQSATAVLDQSTFNVISSWGNGAAPNFDEIRFGATYADVIGQGIDTSGDLTAPTPSPMSFATPPTAVLDSAITMTATTASDANGVQYRFHNTTRNTYSAWQDSPTFTDTGLAANTSYSYTVQARDKSVNQNTNTESSPLPATTLPQDTVAPPTPGFATAPTPVSATEITMTSTIVTDPEGAPVQYRFHNTTLGTNSGWQSGTTYNFTGLIPSTTYSFTVQARDTASTPNETAQSAPLSATTLGPTSGTWAFDSDGTWSDSGKWTGNLIAVGSGATAFFTSNITANRIISLDTPRTIGNITFTDSTSSSNDLTITGAKILTLDVSSGSPVIDVTQSGRSLTIASVITGTKGLRKNGAGRLALVSNNTYSGTTSVTNGMLDLGAVSLAGVGGGSGRNISVSAGAAVLRTTLDNTLLNRLVENSEECTLMTGATSNNLDFSSSTGANLPKAFLGNWASNGAKCEYSGTLTPAADAYRLGGQGSAGLLGIVGTNKLTGNRGLIVGGTGANGVRVELAGANDFNGDTVINSGAKLTIGNNLTLRNSALNVGAAGGNIAFSTGLLSGRITGSSRADSPSFGGLIGSRNLATVFSASAGNNEQLLQSYQMLGFTLNTGAAANHTYSGIIANFARDTAITKSGSGTQELSGNNTHTGLTTIGDGILKIGHPNALGRGGSAGYSSGATVVNGGSLDLNGMSAIVEPLVLNGLGFGGNGALVNNSGVPATLATGIASVQVLSGGTYSTVPAVTISGGGGSGATATATLGVTNATITSVTSGGTGWAVGDQFTVNGGGGSGAVYQVTSVNNGAITGWNVIHAGSGYNAAPTGITRITGNSSGTNTFVFNSTNFAVSGITLTNFGSGYTGPPSVSFSSGTATADVQMSSITLASNTTVGGSGNISIAIPISQTGGAQGLTKVGAGMLTISGANTYTGATTISGGTLALGANHVLPVASPVSIGSATLDAATFSDALGTLDVTGTATINLGTGAALAFSASNTINNGSWSGALNITGTLGATSIRFGNDNTGLTAAQLAKITVNGTGSYTLDPNGYLVVAPSSAYDTWKSANAPGSNPGDDTDGDGVSNAVEFVLGGTSATHDIGKLPVASTSGSDMLFTFYRMQSSIDPKTSLFIETSSGLATWNTAPSPYSVPDGAAANNPGVTVEKNNPASGTDKITLRIPGSTAAAAFARLKVSILP